MPMRRRISAIIFCCAFSIIARAAAADCCAPPNYPLPQFKSAAFNVRDFGATGNGRDNDTAAINRAIAKCSAEGGGDITFPAGTYLGASIRLQSNVRLVLDKDAIITGAQQGYDPPEPNEFEKYQDFGHSHFHNALMWGEKIENFAIIGGRINGGYIIEGDDPQGGGVGDKVISIKSGRNLLFDGVTHQSGGHFVYLLNDCENVTLSNIVIKKSRDGVNLVSCRNVQMRDCSFTGCGDDTLALKSDYALGRKIESANIYVWNCYFESVANALEFGAESVGDFRNVNFWSVRIGRAWKAGIGIRSTDGSVIDGVTYRNISMKSVDTPISIVLGKRLSSGDPNRSIGTIRNITLSNITAVEPRPRKRDVVRPSLIRGLPEHRIENILLEHVGIVSKGSPSKQTKESSSDGTRSRQSEAAFPAAGFFVENVRGLRMNDVTLNYESPDSRASIVARDVADLELNDVKIQKFPGIHLMRLEKIDNLLVHHSAGLADRQDRHIDQEEQ